jgi:anti-anti-sigma factor
MEGIQISVYYVGAKEDIALIQIGGYLDTVTSPQLERALEHITTEGYCHIICDLGNVNYISSAGWGIFVSKIKMIRDMGGDLVLAQMIPDVFDVFKLLEFDRILKFFDGSDKAVKEFDEARGLLSAVSQISERPQDLNPASGVVASEEGLPHMLHRGRSDSREYPRSMFAPTVEKGMEEDGDGHHAKNRDLSVFPYPIASQDVLERDLPLMEKVKLAVIDNPLAGANAIRRVLNSSRFGYVRVGFFKIRKLFKELDLDTKEKRYRFWRSR